MAWIDWLWIFMLHGFIGWLFAMLLAVILIGKPVKRGLLIGPICPSYGIGSMLLVAFMSKTHHWLMIAAASAAIGFVLAAVGVLFFETIGAARWQGARSLRAGRKIFWIVCCGLLWGAGGLLLIRWLYPLEMEILDLIPSSWQIAVGCLLLLLIGFDAILAMIRLVVLNRRLAAISAKSDLLKTLKSPSQREAFRKVLAEKSQMIRVARSRGRYVLRAYPDWTSKRYENELSVVRQKLSRRRKLVWPDADIELLHSQTGIFMPRKPPVQERAQKMISRLDI